MLTIKNLNKSFSGVKSLNNLNLEIQPNKITAIIGGNGAGKTTLFNVLSGLIKQDSGQILFENTDISKLDSYKRARLGITRTFQTNGTFPNLTVYENLLLAGDYNTSFISSILGFSKEGIPQEHQIIEVLNQVKLLNHKDKLAKNLSGGQQKLLELARSFLSPHKILLLDEPLAGVSPSMRQEILEMLKFFSQKKETVVFIEHDINFISSIADVIVTMEQGEVVEINKSK
jgi:ABC-type branched-subunit amino acid transport system ATPase component